MSSVAAFLDACFARHPTDAKREAVERFIVDDLGLTLEAAAADLLDDGLLTDADRMSLRDSLSNRVQRNIFDKQLKELRALPPHPPLSDNVRLARQRSVERRAAEEARTGAAAPAAPAASLSQLAAHFRELEPLRGQLGRALDGWKPPVVVVFGAESCGKSTLLERIAMQPLFPTGDDICTRLPIVVELRNEPAPTQPTISIWEKSPSGGADKDLGGPGALDADEDDAAELVRRTMDAVIKREHSRVTGISQKTYLKLRLAGPDLPTLDLLDLPGLVNNRHKGEPATMRADTHALVDRVVDETEGRAIYLMCREVGTPTRQCQALEVLQRHAGIARWTLGVLTKCDDANRRKIRAALAEKEGTAVRLSDHGYVATMNAPLRDAPRGGPKAVLVAKAQAESQFFEEERLADLVADRRATTNALVDRVCEMYERYLVGTWVPKTMRLLRDKQAELGRRDADLGLPAAHRQLDASSLTALRQKVGVAAAQLVGAGMGAYAADTVVAEVLMPLESDILALLKKECDVGGDGGAEFRSGPQRVQTLLPSAGGDGRLLEQLQRFASAAARKVETGLVTAVRAALETDVAGRGDGTPVRVGRFKPFVGAVVARLQEGQAERIAALQRRVTACLRDCVRRLVRPRYDLARREATIAVLDRKEIADAVTHVLYGAALAGQGRQTGWLRDAAALQGVADAVGGPEAWLEDCVADRAALWHERDRVVNVTARFEEMVGKFPQVVAHLWWDPITTDALACICPHASAHSRVLPVPSPLPFVCMAAGD